jgi:hypothetical protein
MASYPDRLPGEFEQKERKHPHRVAKAQQGQQRDAPSSARTTPCMCSGGALADFRISGQIVTPSPTAIRRYVARRR